MPTCTVPGCRSDFRNTTGLSYFNYPLKNEDRLRQWLQSIGRPNWQPKQSHRICSLHFTSDCIVTRHDRRFLTDNAVPTAKPCDVIPTVVNRRCIQSAKPCDVIPNVVTELSAASIPLISLIYVTPLPPLPAKQQHSTLTEHDYANRGICSDVASSSSVVHGNIVQTASADNAGGNVVTRNNNGNTQQTSSPNLDHAYYSKSVKATKRRAVHADHNYINCESPDTLRRQLLHTQSLLVKARHRQKLMRQTIRRLNKKIQSLTQETDELRNKDVISDTAAKLYERVVTLSGFGFKRRQYRNE